MLIGNHQPGIALLIEATAKIRLADEYDAAQEREEISKQGAHVVDGNMSTANIGIRRDEIHEARKLRDAEAADPGVIERSLGDMRERGEEPTILLPQMLPQSKNDDGPSSRYSVSS